MLHEDIKKKIPDAMRARDAITLSVLRGMVAAFTNELVAQKRPPQEMLSDEETLAVIKRQVKQRKESIEQFKKGNRDDLVQKESAELAILETYLPATMSMEEIERLARAKKDELGITQKSDSGKLMAALMKDLKGKADGGDVKTAGEKLFWRIIFWGAHPLLDFTKWVGIQ